MGIKKLLAVYLKFRDFPNLMYRVIS